MLSGILAHMTLPGVGLDASLDNVSLVLSDGKPQALLLHRLDNAVIYKPRFSNAIPNNYTGKSLSSVGELHRSVFACLFQRHLALIIEQVRSLTKLSKKVMWSNAGNLCVLLYDHLAKCPGAGAVTEDRLVLLEKRSSPVMPGQNPLYRPVRYEKLTEPGLPSVVKVRRTCCQTYRMPDSKPCGSCPLLKPEERIARLKQNLAK